VLLDLVGGRELGDRRRAGVLADAGFDDRLGLDRLGLDRLDGLLAFVLVLALNLAQCRPPS
jgi:hypothetical protein